jgi:hypothetical protein
MAGAYTTITIKDSESNDVDMRAWDESGADTGPYSFVHKIGAVKIIPVTLSLDTSAYSSGDLLADTQAVAGAVRENDGTGILHSVTVIDEDDQGVAFDLYFLSANNTLGSENSAPSISDANARDILTRVPIAAADYTDLGGVKIAEVHGLNRLIQGASGSTSIYVAAVNGSGSPTFSASGLKLRIGIIQD